MLAQIRGLAGGVRERPNPGMSWLNEYVRPRIRTLFSRREVPDNLWVQCPNCQQMLFTKDLERSLKVCPHCGYHMRVTAAERLAFTFDPATRPTPAPATPASSCRACRRTRCTSATASATATG